MHELSIAQSVVDIVRQHLPAGAPVKVRSVTMHLGEVSGIVADSLDFCFTAIIAGTPLEGATLVMQMIPLKGRCRSCGATSAIDQSLFACPDCGGNALEIVSGREMKVVEVEVE